MTNERADKLRREVSTEGFAHGRVSGDSMEPTLHVGETVRLEPCALPRPGDVVAFAAGGGLMIHRALCVRGGRALCRGDNRTAHDGWVPAEAVVGRAVAVFGPTRPGGEPLVGGARGLCLAARLAAARATRLRGGRAAAEARLLWRQVRGLPLGELEGRLDSHGVPADVSVDALSPADALAAAPTAAEAAGGEEARGVPALLAGRLAIPAGVYCRLPKAERVRLLRLRLRHARAAGDGGGGSGTDPIDDASLGGATTLSGAGSTSVYAYAAVGALIRLTSAARRALRRAGFAAGEPGDRAAPWPGVGPGLVHVFAAHELEAELAAATGVRWSVDPAKSAGPCPVPLWRATPQPGQGA